MISPMRRAPTPPRVVERAFAALFAALDVAPRLSALLAAHPDLGAAGFTTGPAQDRPTEAEVRRCLHWLAEEARSLDGVSSYLLKHEVERWTRVEDPHVNPYTSNGAMIAALILAGWPVSRCGLNARVRRERTAVMSAAKVSASSGGAERRDVAPRSPRAETSCVIVVR